jgi:hypothetical protein
MIETHQTPIYKHPKASIRSHLSIRVAWQCLDKVKQKPKDGY